MAGHDDPLATRLASASNVLVVAEDDHANDACTELLADAGPDARVLSVTTRSPADAVAALRSALPVTPAQVRLVAVGTDGADSPVPVEAVPAGDLTGIGIAVSGALADWEDADGGVYVCVDSVTDLLADVPLQRSFRFLHVLTGRARTADARAHYHLRASARGDGTVDTLLQLFDAAVERAPGEDTASGTDAGTTDGCREADTDSGTDWRILGG